MEAIQISSRIHLWLVSYQGFLSGQLLVQLYLILLGSVSLRDISKKLWLCNFLSVGDRRNNLVCLIHICVHKPICCTAIFNGLVKSIFWFPCDLIKKNWKLSIKHTVILSIYCNYQKCMYIITYAMCSFRVHLTLYNLPLKRFIHFIFYFCTQKKKKKQLLIFWEKSKFNMNGDQILLFSMSEKYF